MRRTLLVVMIVVALLLPVSQVYGAQSSGGSNIESQKTAAAVTAVDEHWLQAEVHGDVVWLESMLLPEYRSVSSSGVVSPKAKILSSARKNAGSNGMAIFVAKYMKEHPSASEVVVHGDTAILTFYSKKIGPDKGVKSSDVFVYIGGQWHAIYSMHTALKS